MKLPIIKKLKKREYSEIAVFQDAIIDLLYNADNSIVLHGGTVVWRCFSGNRFSNDIDAYLNKKIDMDNLRRDLESIAEGYNIKIEKTKDTGNLIFIGFSIGTTYLKVEINHIPKSLKPIATRFERVDGTFTDVLTLTPDELILEKIAAYSNRRFIRDIYDMYILSSYIQNEKLLKEKLSKFIDNLKEPIDEEELKILIYDGPVPTFKSMINSIRGRTL